MEFKKIYSAKVISVRQAYTDVTGMRQFEIWFRGAKKMYYERSSKQQMLIVPGNTIRFTATKIEPNLFWRIDDVLDSYDDEQILLLHHREEEKKRTEGFQNYL